MFVVSYEDSDYVGGIEMVIGVVLVCIMLVFLFQGYVLCGVVDESGICFIDCLVG